MIKIKRNYFRIGQINDAQIRFIPLSINDGTLRDDETTRTFLLPRVHINNRNVVTRLGLLKIITTIQNAFFRSKNNATIPNMVKRCVRVDDDLLRALDNRVNFSNSYATRLVHKAVLDKLQAGELDLIPTWDVPHRITLFFTKKESDIIDEIVKELRDRELDVTFSMVVRSILYEYLGLITFETSKPIIQKKVVKGSTKAKKQEKEKVLINVA